ncbi:MAG: small multi-drug export protein [Nanoarchaeota archaeon]|nr:small multi-drug export protein [Nanoarchaeota archaeon]
MLREILELVFITFIPALELRASIPYGILKQHMDWVDVFIICVVANILLGILVYFLLDKFVHLVIKVKVIGKVYHKFVERTQKKIHPYVEKYGTLGVALFIGVPLPGSGVYTGALGSYLLGLGYRKFFIACVVGVIIAGVAVTLITLFGSGAWNFFIKNV